MSHNPAGVTASALPVEQRLPLLDILRGVALMGILIMNMPGFSSSVFAEADGSHLWSGALDRAAENVRDTLFSGKFNSMFSLLFGLGFTIQFQRMQRQDPDRAVGLYLRRLLVLLGFGLVHACIFWTGDILHLYALLGLLMLFALRHASDRTLIGLMVACLAYPALSGTLRVLVITPAMTAERVAMAQAFEASNNLAFGQGGLLDMAQENLRMMIFFYTDPLSLWGAAGGYVMIALTMLIGLLAGRRRWAQRVPELLPQIRRLTPWALAAGIGFGIAFTAIFELNRMPGPSPVKVLGSVCYSLSRLSMTLFYVLVIVRLTQQAAGLRWLSPFAATGRMPLTNYLLQSAMCITIFDGWGLGLWGQVGPAAGLLLALVLYFGVQVPASLWWLRRHDRGPVEALWARLTYGAAGAPRLRSA